MPLESPNWVAGASIRPSRILVASGAADHTKDRVCIEATNATTRPIGISQAGGREAPLPSVGTVYAAKVNETLAVIGEGQQCSDLLLAATLQNGQLIMADSAGCGIVATGAGAWYVAQALGYGVAGDRIPVQVTIGQLQA